MKIIFILALVLIVFVVFRRMNRDVVLTVEPPKLWEQRPPLAFDDFYAQHYADSGLSKEVVQAGLEQLSRLLKVPAEQLRPDDRLEDLNPGAIEKAEKWIETLSNAPLIGPAIKEKLASLDLNIVTVDDYIRKLAHLGEQLQGEGA